VSLFDKPDTLLLLARDGDELLGYALTHVLLGAPALVATTSGEFVGL
jgi:hypothetical protein